MSEEQRNIEKVIRAWVTRPTSTSARMARARVLTRLAEKRPRFGWRLVTAALLIALAAGGLYVKQYAPELEEPDGPPPLVSFMSCGRAPSSTWLWRRRLLLNRHRKARRQFPARTIRSKLTTTL